jgi:hypothetical protein
MPVIPDEFRQTGRFVKRAGDAPLDQFQVLGERASATNLVRKIIDKNVELQRTEALGWKHATPHMVAIPRGLLSVCVVRNAESWALSMHKRPWHSDPAMQRLGFSDFLRHPWHGIVDRAADFEQIHPEIRDRVDGLELQYDRHPITGLPYRNLFELRNVKMAAMLGMLNRDCNVLLVKAEVVQADDVAFAAWMLEDFDLPLRGERIKGVRRRLGNRFKRTEDVGETPARMSDEDRAYMLSQLDMEQEAALGYAYAEG